MGIPAVAIVGSDFTGVAKNVCKGMGFWELPLAVVPEKVLNDVGKEVRPSFEKAMVEVIHGLTEWKGEARVVGVVKPEHDTFIFEGLNYQDAVDKMNKLFLEYRFGDGLPLVPATKERVEWLLRGTDLAAGYEVAKIPPRMGIATLEMIAVNAAMAGARPEHMPVIIAIIEALAEPAFQLDHVQGTTNPSTPMVVVNGPAAKEIGINSSYGCLGPNPAFPAGAVIGRAIRLIMNTLGGGIPGVTDMSPHGQPGKFTNLVFAEAEEKTPWNPLHVELGYELKANTVTVFTIQSTVNICCLASASLSPAYLEKVAKYAAVPSWNCFSYQGREGPAGFLLIPPSAAQALADQGWSKQDVKEFLYEHARIPLGDFRFLNLGDNVETLMKTRCQWCRDYVDMPPDTPLPITWGPDGFVVVVTGGDLHLHWQWLPVGTSSTPIITKEIRLPVNWDELIKEPGKPSP